MLKQLLIGAAAMAATVGIQAIFMTFALNWAKASTQRAGWRPTRSLAVTAVILWFFVSICIQCWGWAWLLLYLGALNDLETALYFTIVTYATLGYGDVVLTPDWRLLGAVAALNGTIIVGWTTAMVIAVVQLEYSSDEPQS
ncbi:MAG: two pore domain potassium channel family protein [Alphaproteobacteria bacterium]|nr:two pore domain potassium channel family protein [Alphaproteobacteria bacterium]MCB9930585.1 two pore domain potassium channel family protein [Alphaproteobacteria bacterium]